MVYINSDGSIGARPWLKQVSNFLWSFVNFISTFFLTLLNPALNGRANEHQNIYKKPGDGPPRPPQHRTSRFATLSSCQAPMPGGG